MQPQRRFWFITVAALLAVCATALLGRWQLSRAAQKELLHHQIELQSKQAPLNQVDLLALLEPSQEIHRMAVLRGRWIPAKTVFLDNRQMNARPGFFVVTPFKIEGSASVLLVQRGWVARNFETRAQVPVIQTPTGVVEISGRVALAPSKLYELGDSDAGLIRQNLDLEKFRQETQLPLIDVTLRQTGAASEGLLREWSDVASTAGKNYAYAFQWFALAGLISCLYVWFQIVKRNRAIG